MVVLEGVNATLATRAPFSDLGRPIVMPAFRFKVVTRRKGGRHREELWLKVCASIDSNSLIKDAACVVFFLP